MSQRCGGLAAVGAALQAALPPQAGVGTGALICAGSHRGASGGGALLGPWGLRRGETVGFSEFSGGMASGLG